MDQVPNRSGCAVTIGIPVRNEIASFDLAVRSIFAQTVAEWELIIALDGASDAVRAAANAIQDPRVRVLDDGLSRGLPYRLNQITRHAAAPLIARMDADDVMLPTRIGSQLSLFEGDPGLDLVASRALLIDDSDKVLGLYKEPPQPSKPIDFLQSGVFTHPTVMYRRSWALKYPYESSWKRTEDKEVWLRAAGHFSSHKAADPQLLYRVPKRLSLPKQALTAFYDRKLIRAVGGNVGADRGTILRYCALSIVKQAVFAIGVTLGLSRFIQRSKVAPSDLTNKAELDLKRISNTTVPGWEPRPARCP